MSNNMGIDMGKSIKDSMAALKEQVHEHHLFYEALGAGIVVVGAVALRGKFAEIKSAWKAMADDAMVSENRPLLDELRAAGGSAKPGSLGKTETSRRYFRLSSDSPPHVLDSEIERIRVLMGGDARGATRAPITLRPRGMAPIEGAGMEPSLEKTETGQRYFRLSSDSPPHLLDSEIERINILIGGDAPGATRAPITLRPRGMAPIEDASVASNSELDFLRPLKIRNNRAGDRH